MKIKLNTLLANANGVFPIGSEVDVDPKTARHLVDSRQAEAIDPFPAEKKEKKKEVEVSVGNEIKTAETDSDENKKAV